MWFFSVDLCKLVLALCTCWFKTIRQLISKWFKVKVCFIWRHHANQNKLHNWWQEPGTSSTLLPERFTSGDLTSLLRHFEHCASANGWEYDVKLVKLPAFLQGPAAPYSDSFLDEEKSSLRLLTESLSRCFSPALDREQFYRQFEEQTLWPGEDRSLFLW